MFFVLFYTKLLAQNKTVKLGEITGFYNKNANIHSWFVVKLSKSTILTFVPDVQTAIHY